MSRQAILFIVTTLLSFCLAGCSVKHKYEKTRQINLNLDFVLNRYATGFFHYKDSLYIYTHNYPTYKILHIFNQNGKLVRNVPLNPSMLKTDKIKVEIIHPDSIYVLANERNELYLLNQEGKTHKKIKLDSIIRQKTMYKKTRYNELNLFSFMNMVNKNSLLLTAFIMDTSYHPPQDNYKNLLRYNNQYLSYLPRLIIMRNVLDTSAQVIIEPTWINKIIANNDEVHNVLPYCIWIKDTVAFHLPYDRNVYILNSDLSLRRKIPINSDFAPLEYPKKKIAEAKDYEINYEAMYRSEIDNVYFDTIHEKYYVSIRLELPLPKKDKLSYTSPFDYNYSIIQYSKKWKKEAELCLPESEIFISFLPNGQFVTQSKSKNPRNITLNFYQWTE